MLPLPDWLASICAAIGLSLGAVGARLVGKLCHRLLWAWLAIPLGIGLGGITSFMIGYGTAWLVWPSEVVVGDMHITLSHWPYKAVCAVAGAILGGCAAGGCDVNASTGVECSQESAECGGE
jgi:hypothetical protein